MFSHRNPLVAIGNRINCKTIIHTINFRESRNCLKHCFVSSYFTPLSVSIFFPRLIIQYMPGNNQRKYQYTDKPKQDERKGTSPQVYNKFFSPHKKPNTTEDKKRSIANDAARNDAAQREEDGTQRQNSFVTSGIRCRQHPIIHTIPNTPTPAPVSCQDKTSQVLPLTQ